MRKEHRGEAREQVELPIRLADGAGGVTQNISASGLLFEVDCSKPLGSEIDLTVELQMDNRTLYLKCHGKVVRVESHGNRTGIAVQMLSSHLQAAG